MFRKMPRHAEGTHEHDVQETTNLLEEVRLRGAVTLRNTMDGDLDLYFDKKKKVYTVYQSYDHNIITMTDVPRREIQAYLIELRERRRAEDKKRKKVSK